MNTPDRQGDPDSGQDATNAEPQHEPVPRILAAPIAILIAVMMIGLPVLRILTEQDEGMTREQAVMIAREQAALRFASAVLESRAPSLAARYSVPEIDVQVNGIITDLRLREPGDLQGAVARTDRTVCTTSAPERECYRARLERAGHPPVIEISFAVEVVDGQARVVAVGRPGTVLLHAGGRGG